MPTAPETIEGTWDEIVSQADKFDGHRLRVTILPAEEPSPAPTPQDRLAAFDAWTSLPRPPVKPLLDDSRAVIYSDDEDRG